MFVMDFFGGGYPNVEQIVLISRSVFSTCWNFYADSAVEIVFADCNDPELKNLNLFAHNCYLYMWKPYGDPESFPGRFEVGIECI